MRNIHNESNDESCTVTISIGKQLDKNGVNGDKTDGTLPSVQNSVFFRVNFADADLLLLRDDELDAALLHVAKSSSTGR